MQLKKYYMIECVLCFMRLPCISFVHTPCLPCICSFCSFALLFVRSPDLCSFNHQFAFSLFIHSFAFSLLVPFFFFFFYSLVSSLFLLPIHSFSLSFSLFQSPVRCLRSSLTRSFSPAFFGYLALLFKFLQSIFHCIFHPFFFIIFFYFLSPTGRSLFYWFVGMPFRSPLRRFLVSCPPPPFLTPSPLSFFSSSVLLSPPLFLFAIFFVLNSQRNVSHFNPSKGCFIEKIFYKTVYSSYVVHGTAFRVFLSHLYCRRKETLHW